jgi:hypothetical protein
MMKDGVVTLSGSAQQLSAVLGFDERVRRIRLQPDTGNSNPCYFGGATIDGTNRGMRIPAPIAAEPPAPYVEEGFQPGEVSLSDLYVIGTSTQKLRVSWIPWI